MSQYEVGRGLFGVLRGDAGLTAALGASAEAPRVWERRKVPAGAVPPYVVVDEAYDAAGGRVFARAGDTVRERLNLWHTSRDRVLELFTRHLRRILDGTTFELELEPGVPSGLIVVRGRAVLVRAYLEPGDPSKATDDAWRAVVDYTATTRARP